MVLRGKWRDAATLVASLTLGFAVFELGSAALEAGQSSETRGFSTSRPILGWGPSAPGVYYGKRIGSDAAVIYDAAYTIDDHLLRRTLSAATGPTVAFFGDSLTFGQGLSDSETVPQAYADLTGRKARVLNFGFPGYGPQQFLRALETGLFDPLLSDAKIFVYETAAWHAERSACLAGYMMRAARYELRDGEPVFVGACAEGLNRVFREIFINGAAFRRFVQPVANVAGPADVELYLAELQRSAELVKQKFGARLIVLYLSEGDAYLAKSGFTDALIMERLQQSDIDVIDATLSPKDFPPGTLFKIPGDGHPTAIANRAYAALLWKFRANQTATVIASPAVK
ncbi:MAG: SGNH/GDSL hydrolase family protein [Beijerinckiaceae bacterium]